MEIGGELMKIMFVLEVEAGKKRKLQTFKKRAKLDGMPRVGERVAIRTRRATMVPEVDRVVWEFPDRREADAIVDLRMGRPIISVELQGLHDDGWSVL